MVLKEQQLKRLARLDGMCKRVEGLRLAELAAGVPRDLAIVEIGAYRGKSTCYMALGARAGGGAHLYSIDLWTLGGQRDKHGGDGLRKRYEDPANYQAYLRQVEDMGVIERVTPIVSASSDAAAEWKLPIGLLFIDGEHSYTGCYSDILNWTPHVVPGGWVALHDHSARYPGVVDACREWFEERPGWEVAPLAGTVYSARKKPA